MIHQRMTTASDTSQFLPRLTRKAEYLDADTERKLARAWRDHRDEQALHRLVTAYLRLAGKMAGKFRNYGHPIEDLFQEASMGLMRAAEGFDPDRGHRFSTYAAFWIRAQLQNVVLRNHSLVRIGTTST